MTSHIDDGELNRVNEIISNLPAADREVMEQYLETARKHAVQAATAAVMARNFSHNLGLHCRVTTPW